MKPSKSRNHLNCFSAWLCLLFFLVTCAVVNTSRATILPPGPGAYLYLDAWAFDDTNTWATVLGKTPVSYTNLSATTLGDGNAMVVDSTNAAWLQYNCTEADGTTNLCVGPTEASSFGSRRTGRAPTRSAGPAQEFTGV